MSGGQTGERHGDRLTDRERSAGNIRLVKKFWDTYTQIIKIILFKLYSKLNPKYIDHYYLQQSADVHAKDRVRFISINAPSNS